MLISEMHYAFKIEADKVDSLKNRNFIPAEIDWLLNEAILLELDAEYGPPKGFEITQKRIDELSTLVIKSPSTDQPGISVTAVTGNSGCYEADLSQLAFPYSYMVRMRARATDENCGTKNIEVREIQHDDLTKVLRSPFEGPNFLWFRVPVVFGKKQGELGKTSVYLYTNELFTIDLLYAEYIKFPVRVFYGGYNSLDGQYTTASSPVNSDMPEITHPEIVSRAVLEAKRDIIDPSYQAFLQKVNQYN